MTDTVAAILATLVAVALALSTFERFLARRGPHELAWSIALGFFAIASAALALGVTDGWSGPTYRVFFLFGAIVNVPVLALGTVYLLAGRRAGNLASIVVGLGCAFSAGVLVAVPITHPLAHLSVPQGSQILPVLPQVLAGVGSGLGSVVIVGGALYSIWRRRLVLTNLLIASGTLVTGASGIANSAFDRATAFSVALGAGITIIFIGFLAGSGPRPTATIAEEVRPPR